MGWKEMTREELEKEIRLCEQALMFAGPVHYRDLQKHIKRMQAQIKQFDRYQAAERRGVG